MSYSNVFDYLAEEQPVFNQCLEDYGFLDSLKKRSNLTLLIPANIEEFADKCREDDDLSQNMLKALVINSQLKTSSEWDRQREQLTNKLGQKIEVKSITKSCITLGNGVVLKAIPGDFNNISIWKIEKGQMPLDGQKVKVTKAVANKVEDDSANLRVKIAQKLEMKYDRGNRQTFLDFMAILMRIIKEEDKTLYNTLIGMLDPSPVVSFYLFVEPYKINHNYIIPGYILKKVSSKLQNSLRSWKSNFVTPANYDAMRTIVDELTEEILSDVGAKGQLEKIRLAYDDFTQHGGIFTHMSHEVKTFYSQNPNIKLWQDGARHLIRQAFEGDKITRDDVIQEMFAQYVPDVMNTIVTDFRFYKRNGTVAMYEGLAGEFLRSGLLMYIPNKPIVDDESVISKTWESLESNMSEYNEIDDDIIRQLRDIAENDTARFERIMREVETKSK